MSVPTPPMGRPVAAFAFGLIGGILIIIGGAFFSLVWWLFGPFALIGLAFGIVVVIASIMLYAQPAQHVGWGIIVLLFSVFSVISFGGFIAGMAFGIVGGALGIAWGTPRPAPYVTPYAAPYVPSYAAPGSPPYVAPYAAPVAPYYGYAAPSVPMGPWGVPVMQYRMCTGCGRWIPWSYNVCPMCGTRAPVASWAAPPATPTPAEAAPAAAQAPEPFAMPPPAVEPAPIQAPCPTCDGDAEWLPLYRKWYCPKEFRYF